MKNEIKIRIKLFLSTKQGVTITQDKLLNIKEASIRATNYTGKNMFIGFIHIKKIYSTTC
jgi:hypothetical protein